MFDKLISDRAVVEAEAQKLPLESQINFYDLKLIVERMSREQAQTAVMGLMIHKVHQDVAVREVLGSQLRRGLF